MEIKLSGWKAIAAIAVLVLFVGYRYFAAVSSLDEDGGKVVKEWVAGEYQRYHLAREDLTTEEKAALLLQTQDIEFVSMTARGSLKSMAIRVVIDPNEAHPPEMPVVRYYKFKYSEISGWTHSRDLTAFRYYLTLF